MELIDTHCHLDVPEFDPDRDCVLRRCRDLGLAAIVVPGVDAAALPGLLALCRREPLCWPALGLHPMYTDRHRPQDVETLRALVARERPVAIGEIGLDFYVPDADREAQQALFEAQLRIAAAADLPVLLHARKAHDQTLATLRRIRVRGGIAHAFNGSLEQARQYLDLGFKLGIGGMVTFERSRKIRRLAAELPLSALVLETDAPDMPPAAHQHRRNSPEYLPEILEALARVRGQDADTVAEQTTNNARELFGFA